MTIEHHAGHVYRHKRTGRLYLLARINDLGAVLIRLGPYAEGYKPAVYGAADWKTPGASLTEDMIRRLHLEDFDCVGAIAEGAFIRDGEDSQVRCRLSKVPERGTYVVWYSRSFESQMSVQAHSEIEAREKAAERLQKHSLTSFRINEVTRTEDDT